MDVTEEIGIDFHHYTGARGDYYLMELTGSGCALFDYDDDGDLDLYLVQGNIVEDGKPIEQSLFPPCAPLPPHNRLFRNDLTVGPSGRPMLRFTDVTAPAGVGDPGNGMGCAVGDFNADGFPDLFVTNYGPNVLYRNRGDGTFVNTTAPAGVGGDQWSTSAAFLDYDLDGDLDLYVANYCNCSVQYNPRCHLATRDYCPPERFAPLRDQFFRNDGEGGFVDITESSGIADRYGSGLGVVSADFNRDGFPDIYVANDGQSNQLWMNDASGRFVDTATESGAAFNIHGMAEAGMGVVAWDVEGDGDEDIFITHVTGETNTLYCNDGHGVFEDHTVTWNLGGVSLPFTGFGVGSIDFDNDGYVDLVVANGAVRAVLSNLGTRYPYGMRDKLYRNQGGRRFEDVSKLAGAAFEAEDVGRGLALGDIDNDGDVDVVISNNNGRVRVLLNVVGNRNHFLSVQAKHASPPVDAIGARVELRRRTGLSAWGRVHRDGSYTSAGDVRVHFGLGAGKAIEGVRVHWPGGAVEEWREVFPDTFVTLIKGTGVRRN